MKQRVLVVARWPIVTPGAAVDCITSDEDHAVARAEAIGWPDAQMYVGLVDVTEQTFDNADMAELSDSIRADYELDKARKSLIGPPGSKVTWEQDRLRSWLTELQEWRSGKRRHSSG